MTPEQAVKVADELGIYSLIKRLFNKTGYLGVNALIREAIDAASNMSSDVAGDENWEMLEQVLQETQNKLSEIELK